MKVPIRIRRVLGLLLVIGSLLVGIAAVRAADQREPVVIAARTIAAGVAISGDDLTIAMAHLGGASANYRDDPTSLIGTVAPVTIPEGHLIPRFEDSVALPIVSLPVLSQHLPSLRRGDLVDIWTVDPPATLLLRHAAVVEIGRPTGLTTGISIAVTPDRVPALMAVMDSEAFAVVRR